MDDKHPLGGSHHQKIVVIDDKIAILPQLVPILRRETGRTHRAEMHIDPVAIEDRRG